MGNNIKKLLDEAIRSNGTGNIKNAITNIIEALQEIYSGINPPRMVFTIDMNGMTSEGAEQRLKNLKNEFNDRNIPFPEPAAVQIPTVFGSEPSKTIKMPKKQVMKILDIENQPLKKDGKPKAKPGRKPKVKQLDE